IETVAYIATPKDEEEWAQKLEKFPQQVVTQIVKNERINREKFTAYGQGQQNNQMSQYRNFSFPISPKVELKMRQFKQKYEQETGETLSWNEVFEKVFKELEKSPQAKKQAIIKLCPDCIKERARKKVKNNQVKRVIPAEVQRLIRTRQQNKCDTLNCNHPIEEFHHTKRFALNQSHNPDFIVGLCKKCHNLEHSNWQMIEISAIDQKVLNYRREVSIEPRAGP
ncbi:hypothetical protein HN680_04650, partial [Candidatus Peregrinibacteria bacterium]|nr:hypothetical protein [Candidatus Peregrinibacteria bacterium]